MSYRLKHQTQVAVVFLKFTTAFIPLLQPTEATSNHHSSLLQFKWPTATALANPRIIMDMLYFLRVAYPNPYNNIDVPNDN